VAGTFSWRAGRALVLGVIAMAAVGWIDTLPGVLVALACGVPLALLTPRFVRLRRPLLAAPAAAVAGALAGAVWLGRGALTARLMAGAVAGLAVAPWVAVLGFVLWVRAHGDVSP